MSIFTMIYYINFTLFASSPFCLLTNSLSLLCLNKEREEQRGNI